jgi:hypothetical protein
MQLVGFQPEKTDYVYSDAGMETRLRAAPCRLLNETNSRPITDDTHLVHYKGGWQHILLLGRPFSRFRPRKASWEMFSRYLATFAEALRLLNQRAGTNYTAADLGIVVPFYYRGTSGGFNPLLYGLWRVKEAAKRAMLILRRAPAPGQSLMRSRREGGG